MVVDTDEGNRHTPPKLTIFLRPQLQILSYNVNGLKALVNKDRGLLGRLAAEQDADLLLLQETKLQVCFCFCFCFCVHAHVTCTPIESS